MRLLLFNLATDEDDPRLHSRRYDEDGKARFARQCAGLLRG